MAPGSLYRRMLGRAGLLASSLTVLTLALTSACKKDEAHPGVIDDSSGRPPVTGGGGGTTTTSDGGAAAKGAIATAPAAVRGLAATASDVYFLYVGPGDGGTSADGGALGTSVLARVPKGGGPSQIEVTGGESPRDLTLADGSLYWVDDGAAGSSLVRYGAGVLGALVSGLTASSTYAARSDAVVVATPSLGSVSIDRAPNADAGSIQPVGTLSGNWTPVRLALDGANVFLLATTGQGGSLYKVALAGGVPEEIWTGATGAVHDLAIASGKAFVSWDRGADGQVVAIPTAGGAAAALVSPIDSPTHLAVDGTDVFVATAKGEIVRAPIEGGATSSLATDLGEPAAIAVGDAVFVAVGTSVVRVPR